VQAAHRSRALLDVHAPDGGVPALPAHQAHAGAHGGKKEHVEKDYEDDPSGKED
jgi:hypothetical protein